MLQFLTAVIAITWMAMAPPVKGEVLLLPLSTSARPAQAALDNGMRITASGPWRGVVARSEGERDDRRLLRQGIVALATPAFLCGDANDR